MSQCQIQSKVPCTTGSSSSGVSARPGRVSLTSTSAREVVGLSSGVSSLDDEGVVLCAPWASVELDSISLSLAVVGGVMGNAFPLGDPNVPAYSFRGSTP